MPPVASRSCDCTRIPCTGCNENSVGPFSPVSAIFSAASCRANASAANAANAASCSAAAAMTESTKLCVDATRLNAVWPVPSNCMDAVRLMFKGTRVCLGVGATTATADTVGVGATALKALERLALLLPRTDAFAAAVVDAGTCTALLHLIAVGLLATVLGSGGNTDGAVVSMINDLPGDKGCCKLPPRATGDSGLDRIEAAVVVVGDVGGDGLRLVFPALGDDATALGAEVGANPRLTASNACVDTLSNGGNTNAKSVRSTVGMGTP